MMKTLLIILVLVFTAAVFCTYAILSSGFSYKRLSFMDKLSREFVKVSWSVTQTSSKELVTVLSMTPEHQHQELVTVPLSVTPEHQHHEITSMDDQQSDPKHKFKPFNATGVYTNPNVCLEEMENHRKASKNTNQATKKIVIYNSKSNMELVLNVSGSSFSADHNSWPMTFRKGDIPMKFKILPYPAYFVTASFPGNLYHLLRDTLRGLYGVLLATNRLNSTVKNQVFTRKSYNPLKHPRNSNISTYGALIQALGVRSFPSYQSGPANVCYQHGVFGWKPVPMKELAGYIVKYFNHNNQCDNNGTTVTFMDRAYRKVTNMVSLLESAKSMGLNAQMVRFDLMPFDQQYATIRCTDILVGVQGAGLQWVVFMRPKRALIELIYPKWRTIYALEYKGFNGLVTTTVMGQTDGAQWDWIEKVWGRPYSQKEKENYSIPKYMNSKYNVTDFTAALKGIVSHPHFSKNIKD